MIEMRNRAGWLASLAALLAGTPLVALALEGSGPAASTPDAKHAKPAAPTAHKVSPYRPEKLTGTAQNYYVAAWGIDKLKVSYTASGNLIRFSYRIVDKALAKPLGDERATPTLFGQRSRVLLQVPVMDKVGTLRQTGVQQAGQEYWMVFSNKGNLVKPRDRVNVVIGKFHADGLVVE
jgi:hypothetical protein